MKETNKTGDALWISVAMATLSVFVLPNGGDEKAKLSPETLALEEFRKLACTTNVRRIDYVVDGRIYSLKEVGQNPKRLIVTVKDEYGGRPQLLPPVYCKDNK